MKVIIHEGYSGEEHVVFNVRVMPSGFAGIVARIRCQGRSLRVETDAGRQIHVAMEDVFYLETVDDTVFVYLDHRAPCVIRSLRLMELEERLDPFGFTRVSKAMLVNMSKIVRFRPAGNGRQRAMLENGEEIIISRQYAAHVLEKLSAS